MFVSFRSALPDDLLAQQLSQLGRNHPRVTACARWSGAGTDAAAGRGGFGLNGRFALAVVGRVLDRPSLDGRGGWEIVLLVYGFDGALEAAKEGLCPSEDGDEFHCVGEFVDFLC